MELRGLNGLTGIIELTGLMGLVGLRLTGFITLSHGGSYQSQLLQKE